MIILKSHNLEKPKPSECAMKWEEYTQIIDSEWTSLLSSTKKKESEYQSFFKRHPCMLPRPHTLPKAGTEPYISALISQPILPSYNYRSPDFMWISIDSVGIYAILIEIEDPTKPWWTNKGSTSAKLTEARNQILEWKTWFGVPANTINFLNYYRIPSSISRSLSFKQRYVLIYGRRAEAISNDNLSLKRGHLEGENETYMTYDRLSPNPLLKKEFCVKMDREGYKVISVPPTLEILDLSMLPPSLAKIYSYFRDMDIAIRNNKYLSIEQKEFLIRRWQYWYNWAKELSL